MTLVLHGIKLNDEPLSQPLIGRFDERGGTLGRSDNATFTLPDPERLISRVQAQILFRDEGYWIEHVSTASSTLHNGRPLSAGMRILVSEGDELRVGGYTLVAAFETDETSATVLRGRTVIMQPPGPPTTPRAAPVALSTADATHNYEAHQKSEAPQKYEALARLQSNSTDESLWQSFLQGAGIDLALREGLSSESLREVGTMLTASMRSALDAVLGGYLENYGLVRETAQEDFRRSLGEGFRLALAAYSSRKDRPGSPIL